MPDWEPPTVTEGQWPCVCKDAGEAEAKQVRDYARKVLEADDVNLIDAIVVDLEIRHSVHITLIALDMWGVIRSVKTESGNKEVGSLSMQFDRAEDGFTYTWLYWRQKDQAQVVDKR